MCVNQSCVPVSSVLVGDCTRGCNGNGECNNLARCHCRVGFAPPLCDYPGPGGSVDGGPASDPNGNDSKFKSARAKSVSVGLDRSMAVLNFFFFNFLKFNLNLNLINFYNRSKSVEPSRFQSISTGSWSLKIK